MFFVYNNDMENILTYITYLARYPLAIIVILVAISLAWRSLKSLLFRFKGHSQSAHGFFLMSQASTGGDVVESFSIFPTTILGRGRSNDIRFKDKNILKRHAVLYLYQGKWYIRPAVEQAVIYVNDRKVNQPKIIRNEDIIKIGDRELVFVDERDSAESAGQEFSGSIADWRLGGIPDLAVKTGFSWFLTSLFFIIGTIAIIILMPSELHSLRPFYLAISLTFFFLSQLGYLFFPKFFNGFDRVIYICFIFLSNLGLIIQARFAFIDRIQPDDWTLDYFLEYIQKDYLVQSGVAIVGLIILPIIVLIVAKTNFLEKIYPLCLVATPLFYLITLIMGSGASEWGANLWIRLPGGFSLQLTEFAKISYFVVLAYFFKIRPPLKTQLLFAGWAGLNFILIMLLPDLGSMMILLPVTLIVFVVMTSEYLKTAGILLSGSLIFFVAYKTMDYVQNRLHGWLTLWTETNANNEQIIFGLQAIARGGLLGRGLGVGNPRSIPLASSDMVFSVISEEMGILTGLGILIFFIIIWLRGAKFSSNVRDGFTSGLILSIATYFFIEAAVVIGGTTGLIPLTGATLPMIAKGGSSMFAKWILAGILLGLCCRDEEGAYR